MRQSLGGAPEPLQEEMVYEESLPAFLARLYMLIESPESENIIGYYRGSRKTIIIHSVEQLKEKILPLKFPLLTYNEFTRQLANYHYYIQPNKLNDVKPVYALGRNQPLLVYGFNTLNDRTSTYELHKDYYSRSLDMRLVSEERTFHEVETLCNTILNTQLGPLEMHNAAYTLDQFLNMDKYLLPEYPQPSQQFKTKDPNGVHTPTRRANVEASGHPDYNIANSPDAPKPEDVSRNLRDGMSFDRMISEGGNAEVYYEIQSEEAPLDQQPLNASMSSNRSMRTLRVSGFDNAEHADRMIDASLLDVSSEYNRRGIDQGYDFGLGLEAQDFMQGWMHNDKTVRHSVMHDSAGNDREEHFEAPFEFNDSGHRYRGEIPGMASLECKQEEFEEPFPTKGYKAKKKQLKRGRKTKSTLEEETNKQQHPQKANSANPLARTSRGGHESAVTSSRPAINTLDLPQCVRKFQRLLSRDQIHELICRTIKVTPKIAHQLVGKYTDDVAQIISSYKIIRSCMKKEASREILKRCEAANIRRSMAHLKHGARSMGLAYKDQAAAVATNSADESRSRPQETQLESHTREGQKANTRRLDNLPILCNLSNNLNRASK